MKSTTVLQIAMVWQGRILAYRLIAAGQKVTVGPSPDATFATPPARGQDQRFVLLAPQRRPHGRFRLRLTPSLSGELFLRGETKRVEDVLLTGTPSKRDAAIREIDLDPGDRARLSFADLGDGPRLELRFVDAPALLPRAGLTNREPFLVRVAAITSLLLAMLVGGALIFAPD